MDCTLLAPTEGYYAEKKSEFFALLAPCQSVEESKALLEQERKKRPDARHHCFAYRLADGSERAADDGEPQGTAGAPILDVLRKKNLTRCMLLVTREFGGILLGASGLQRAYRAAAADAAEQAVLFAVSPCKVLSFCCSYARFPAVNRLLEAADCRMDPPVFDQFVTLHLKASPAEARRILSALTELTAGQLAFAKEGGAVSEETVLCLSEEAGEELLPL